jgi:hypothetical protein
MKKHTKEFVQSCTTCQQAKPDRGKYPGLLLPLPVPAHACHTVTLDFITGLPRSKHYNCIIVVVDKFSKYAHFLPLGHPFTALSVAKLYLSEVYRLHGLPVAMVSDRDPVFTSKLWQELFRLAGTKLCLSSAYYPQSDGQTERVNQCLETYLRCFVHSCPSKWLSWLPLAEFWYNTNSHSALGTSPFEVLYGHKPVHFGLDASGQCAVPDLQIMLEERQLMLQQIQLHLQRAQQRMKKQADKGRTDRVLTVGQQVFLKLQPYCQSSVASRPHPKLAFKFFGPFEVVRKINSVAYELALPVGCGIHPVFHVSQLKPKVGSRTSVSPVIPDISTGLQIPETVLETRLIWRGGKTVSQVLVKWSGWDTSLATWEDEVMVKQHFPFAPAWGQAGSRGGEYVNNSTPREDGARPTAENLMRGKPMLEAEADGAVKLRRSSRVKKPNSKYIGANWL